MKEPPIWQQFGEQVLLATWNTGIDEKVNAEVLRYSNFISKNFSKEIIEIVPAYCSLAVYLDEGVVAKHFLDKLRDTRFETTKTASEQRYIVSVPVCYKGDFAPDIATIASANGLSVSEVISFHTKPLYKVSFIGFLPGFPYLGGLDKRLHTPRKKTPQRYVEKGSVGIGGGQTGIYTLDSPGGWNILGRSPLQFISSELDPPSLLLAGDYVKFFSVSKKEFIKIETQIENGTYKIEKEVYNG